MNLVHIIFMDEIFVLIDGYPNYAVSNLGRIKSLNYRHTGKEKILSCVDSSNGYSIVNLWKNNKSKKFYIHRLVAQEFISNPDPENKKYIDHVNTIRDDNRAENLRWVTSKENNNNPLTKQKQLGKKRSDETKQKMSLAKKGKMSEETKQKMSLSHKGKTSPNKGKQCKLNPLTNKRGYY